ncbi:MAG: PilZ domain-containing protein [Gammaproteobacteria bacterium]|nr:PilZ domain-containing protein [Gammaproteobacteria bacterium]MCP5406350.1 PilZ domain-containing protein [Chromatiaceae bacterium]MCP5408018.1 PilZ domain-containing protein [Chromatiaceae bacterium]MCP5442917.1 PilZ domain-containing protein [Chromatiaceae bacterium]
MTVDTRYQPRVDLGIEVQIVHRSRSIRALSQNLSRGGIFLNTTAIKIPTGTFVGLEFAIDDTTWQIDGLVVRQDKAGIGAIFRVPQPELFKIAANYKKASAGKPPHKLPATSKISDATRRKTPAPSSNADY